MSPTSWRTPPNWPTPPAGWTPPEGWQPDPAWGPAPPGWSFWGESGPDSKDDDSALALGHRAARKWRRNESELSRCLEADEELRGFFLANSLRPLTDYIAVTSVRLLAGQVSDLARTPPVLRSARLADVVALESEPAALTRLPKVSARMHDGDRVFLGQLLAGEDEQLLRVSAALPESETSGPVPQTPERAAPRGRSACTEVQAPLAVSEMTDLAPPEGSQLDESTTMEERIRRLLEETVIDEEQARYIRSVMRL